MFLKANCTYFIKLRIFTDNVCVLITGIIQCRRNIQNKQYLIFHLIEKLKR